MTRAVRTVGRWPPKESGSRRSSAPRATIRHRLAVCSAELDAARLLVYAAAANADGPELNVGATSGKAKMLGTETAFGVIDAAVQLHGGVGLRRGSVTERMMRAVRATRIYEGSTEVMQLVIARAMFDGPERRR